MPAVLLVTGAGQSAYGYANSCMEAMCQERRAAGLPAVSIQWPILAHLGYAANNEVRAALSCPKSTARHSCRHKPP